MTTFNSYQPTGHRTKWLLLAASVLVPVLFILAQFHQWFPFRLNGRQFLAYYSIHMISGIAATYLHPLLYQNSDNRKSIPSLVPCLAITGLVLAIARIIQGLYHSKPVLYLVLLTIIYLILLVYRSANRNS